MVVKSTTQSHPEVLKDIFDTLREARIKINPGKCTFGISGGKFLGYMVTPRGIKPNPKKVQAILDLPEPSMPKQIQALMGRMTALNRFISKSSDKGLPFFKLLRKTKPFAWDEACSKAFQELKKHIASLPTLTKPAPRETLILYLSISDFVVAIVLIREEGKVQSPVYYVSKALNTSKLNYSMI